MKLAPIVFTAAFAFAGCGDSSDDENGGNTNPTTGTWFFVGGTLFDDTCMAADTPTDPNGDFTITSTGDGTFTVDDGTNVFNCTVSGSSLNCPARLTDTIDSSILDAVVSINISIAGTFSSATAASGHQTANLACVGADCATAASTAGIASFPCSVSQNFTASRTG